MRYAFWNNKGGTGKTSLAFQTISEYSIANQNEKILAIDLCPQANLSELFLGGLLGNGSTNLESLTNNNSRKSIGAYFQERLSSPYNKPTLSPNDYICTPHNFNSSIPSNIDLIAGDRVIELQSNSISALSITQIPGVDTYIKIVNWVNELLDDCINLNGYDTVFIDTNPSFAIYTQIALASVDRIIAPVMADDSSRRALRNIFSLVYGINLPSTIFNQYSFNNKINNSGQALPKVHLVTKNRLTQYMGPASAYASVLSSIDNDLSNILTNNPSHFTFNNLSDGIVDIRDFQTTGVVAFAKAIPFSRLDPGKHDIFGKVTQVQKDYLQNCIDAIDLIVQKI